MIKFKQIAQRTLSFSKNLRQTQQEINIWNTL